MPLNFRPAPEHAALSTRTSEHYSAFLARSEAKSFAAEQTLNIVLHEFLAEIETRVLAAASHLDDRSRAIPLTMLPT